MTDEEIKAVRERAEAASKGPWEWGLTYEIGDRAHWSLHNPEQPDGGVGDGQDRTINYYLVLLAACPKDIGGVPLDETPDFQFIAHARTDVPRLCDALTEARGEVAAMRYALMGAYQSHVNATGCRDAECVCGEWLTLTEEAAAQRCKGQVYEYDGAFKCYQCGAMWGAVSRPNPKSHATTIAKDSALAPLNAV